MTTYEIECPGCGRTTGGIGETVLVEFEHDRARFQLCQSCKNALDETLKDRAKIKRRLLNYLGGDHE